MQNLQKIFSKLAKHKHKELNIIHNSDQFLYFSDQCVPDQLVGQVTFNGNQYIFNSSCYDKDDNHIFCRETVTNKKQNNPVIIMILESPHKHEFDKNTHTPIGPANGISGKNIRERIDNCIQSLLDETNYANETSTLNSNTFDLILMNAIQFQTSLGYATKIARDDVFKYLWGFGGREDFLERLKKYMNLYCSGGLILNLCTGIKINTNNNFKMFLNQEISNIKKNNFIHGYGGHPAYWGANGINIKRFNVI